MPHARTLLCEIPAEHLNPVAFSTATLISSTMTAPMASCRSGQLTLSKDSDASHSCKPRRRSSSRERKAKGSDVGVAELTKGTGGIGKHQQTAAYIRERTPTARKEAGGLGAIREHAAAAGGAPFAGG